MRRELTINEAVAMVDEMFAQSIFDLEALLIRKGATEDELARELEIAAREQAASRVKFLAELGAWLARDGETLQ